MQKERAGRKRRSGRRRSGKRRSRKRGAGWDKGRAREWGEDGCHKEGSD